MAGTLMGEDPNSKLEHRITVYLSSEGMDTLEETWFNLRRLADPGDRKRISKSLILEEGLRAAAEEFRKKGAKSRLGKVVLDK